MYFIQFFHADVNGALAPACGDRAVIKIDGRLREESLAQLAVRECLQRGFQAYQFRKGTFSRSEGLGVVTWVVSQTPKEHQA